MTTDPDVLALIAERIGQRIDDRFAVADECLARRRFQGAVTEQRQQSRNEQAIRRAHLPSTLDRLLHDGGVTVVEQWNEQRAESRIVHVRERSRGFCASGRRTVAIVGDDLPQRRLGGRHIVGTPWVREGDRGRDVDAGLRIGEMTTHQDGGVFVFELGERTQRGSPHVHVFVLHHAGHGRQPAAGRFRSRQRQRAQGAGAHARRFMLEQERRHELSLVQRIEHLDRVEHGGFVGMRELLDEGLDRRGVGQVGADGTWRNRTRSDAVAKRASILAPCHQRNRHPHRCHDQAGVTQATPIETEAPWADEDEDEHRRKRFSDFLHRHVDERLGPESQRRRHREEEHLARGLV